jgi:hypothetical protein
MKISKNNDTFLKQKSLLVTTKNLTNKVIAKSFLRRKDEIESLRLHDAGIKKIDASRIKALVRSL